MRKIKKYLATALSFCMVFAGSMTAFAAEPGQQSEEPFLMEGSTRIIILPEYEDSSRKVTIGGIYLRENPGSNGKVIMPLEKGTLVYLNGEAEIADGLTWLRVIRSPFGPGWIAEKYLE